MKRLLFALSAAALLLAPAALAKGPSAASITGPGLGKPLSIKGTEGSGPLGRLTESTGFFPTSFQTSPDPRLAGKPSGKLGPKFTIRYLVPGPNNERFRITQDLYPYAKGGAVTYMKPGQSIFDSHTIGGWYRGGSELKQTLVRAGLPRAATRSSSGSNLAVLLGIGAPGAAILAGAAVLVARRRRHS
jgi:hypothetical protein